MAHDLTEKTAGLASRVDNLVALETGDDSRALEALQERLEKRTLASIVANLHDSEKKYQDAVAALDNATDIIGEADHQIQNISKAIKLIAKAADLVEAAIKAAAK